MPALRCSAGDVPQGLEEKSVCSSGRADFELGDGAVSQGEAVGEVGDSPAKLPTSRLKTPPRDSSLSMTLASSVKHATIPSASAGSAEPARRRLVVMTSGGDVVMERFPSWVHAAGTSTATS